MCLSDYINPVTPFHLRDFPEHLSTPEVPTPTEIEYWEIYSSVLNQIANDRDWLEAEPRHPGDLLLRYFGNRVKNLKDLLCYRDLLNECLDAIPGPFVILPPGLTNCWETEEADHGA